jgi:hypothetical protein
MPYFDDDEAIGPEGLDVLRDVMAELCRKAGIGPKSQEASDLALLLVGLYKSGFRSRQELIFMGEMRSADETRDA